MESLINSLLPYILTYKYVALFVITFLGAILLPLPSGTLLMAATALATQGYMNPFAVYLTGVAGNVAGDQAGYWISRILGRPILEKFKPTRKMINSDGFKAIEKQFELHPFLTIFMSRFLTAVAPSVNIFSGISAYPYWRYTLFEVLGEFAEVGMNWTIGYTFGNNWEYIHSLMGNLIYLLAFGILFSSLIWRYIINKSKKNVLEEN